MRWPRYSAGRITLVLGACGLLFILGTAAFIAGREREVGSHEARTVARSTAFSLADHASRLFEVTDLALRTATLSLGDQSWDEAARSRPLWQELKTTSDALPYVRDLFLVDADGRLRVATLAFPPPDGVSMADRTVFRRTRAGADGLVIGEPTVGKVTGKPAFLIARRLASGGTFIGMSAASADLDYFNAYWRRLDLPYDSEVALVRAEDERVLVRMPALSPASDVTVPTLRSAAAAEPDAGRFRPAPHRVGFYHRVGDLPLYLAVSYSEAAVEAGWLSWLQTFLLFPSGATVALFAILGLARRQGRIEARSALEVSRARAALAAANGRLEQRVAERTAELRESNEEIQRFAYIVSHDLRAPLVNIMGFTSELEGLRGAIFPSGRAGDAASEEDFDEAIGFIKTSIDKMDRLIKAILMLARQGSRTFRPEPVDMDLLMRSIADGLAHRALSADATITVGPMPRLVADQIAVEQLFSNLVDNAVKYLRDGTPGHVTISAATDGNRAVFKVADDGRGIAERDHARVFELFRRSGAQDRPGEGIGLAHVKTLVRQLGGTISLDSAPGRGSTFTVSLPLEAAKAHA